MGAAVISLASSVVGGLLVLAGQWLICRSEDRRYWRGLLRDAAADVATSFSQERAWLTSDRGLGKPTSHIDQTTYVIDRQRALNRLLTLPRGDAFESQLRSMGDGIETLWQAYSADEAEWQTTRAQLKEAINAFTSAVRLQVQRWASRPHMYAFVINMDQPLRMQSEPPDALKTSNGQHHSADQRLLAAEAAFKTASPSVIVRHSPGDRIAE
jgi:hypothetical protein